MIFRVFIYLLVFLLRRWRFVFREHPLSIKLTNCGMPILTIRLCHMSYILVKWNNMKYLHHNEYVNIVITEQTTNVPHYNYICFLFKVFLKLELKNRLFLGLFPSLLYPLLTLHQPLTSYKMPLTCLEAMMCYKQWAHPTQSCFLNIIFQ